MFRGDLALSLSLLSLPGRPGDPLLDVEVVLTCRSNVNQQVTRWNLDAPTGILGQGWSLSGSAIVMTTTGSIAPGARRYAIQTDGVANSLVPIRPGVPLTRRATLDPAARATLAAGTVPSAVVKAFAAQGLALDPSATITGSGPWRIADAVNERDFAVTAAGDGAEVTDGGVSYQLHNYEFWLVVYYPAYERWEVTTDEGEVRSYGGGISSTKEGFGQSAGNSVEWGVGWSSTGVAAWVGASRETSGQVQYARSWHLASRRDRWGSQVTYGYNEFGRDGATGILLRGAEQLVGGAGGLPYTRAVYPTSITSVHGHTIGFGYGDKSYTAAVQEYMDPHKVLVPATTAESPPAHLTDPNAFQDRYETLYLSSITLAPPGRDVVSTFVLEYAPPCAIPGLSDGLQATAAKRYLTGITETNAFGQSLPPHRFTYALAEGAGPNYGALASVLYPQGATATWTYGTAGVTAASRQLTLHAPAALGASCAPWVWFGPDYAVVLWVNGKGTAAQLDVYGWVGGWVGWSGGNVYASPRPMALPAQSPIAAQLGESCFCLVFTDDQGALWPVLFGRSSATPTQWSACTPQPGLDPSATLVSLSGGDSFVVATVEASEYELHRWTWDWLTGTFTGTVSAELASGASLYAAAANEVYLTAAVESGNTTLSLSWLNPASNAWTTSPGTVQLAYDAAATSDHALHWAVGPSCAALALTRDTLAPDYHVALLTWDGAYVLTSQLVEQVYDPYVEADQPLSAEPHDQETGAPFPPLPIIGGDGFVGVRQFVFRFDGTGWRSASFGGTSGSLEEGWLATSFGADVAVQTVNDGTASCTATLIAYDANAGGFATRPRSVAATLPGPAAGMAYQGWPSAVGADYVVAQNALFYRGSDTSWSLVETPGTAVHAFPGYDGTGFDSTSLIDGSPSFLAGVTLGATPADSAVAIMPLRNGGVPPALSTALSATVYGYNSPNRTAAPLLPGQGLSGPSTLVTWPASAGQLSEAQSLTLYQYAGQAMSGAITAYPVTSLSITDGFGGTVQTAYEFDTGTATCDPTGTAVKFLRSTAYDGCTDPGQSALGRSVYVYQNGYVSAATAAMLDGLPVQTLRFAGRAAFATAYDASYGLDPAAATNGPATTVPAALVAVFQSEMGVALGASSTLQYLQPDADLLGSGIATYAYWEVTDPVRECVYNVDFLGDPANPGGGQLRVFTGQVVETTSTAWRVFTSRNVDPTAPDAAPMGLHGGFARPTGVLHTCDGVPLLTEYGYVPPGYTAPPNPLVLSKHWSFTGASGAAETHAELHTPVAAVQPLAAGVNLLRPVAQHIHRVTAGGETVTTGAGAVVWQGWAQTGSARLTVLCATQEWSWIGDPTGVDTGTFPFGGTPRVALWVQRHQLTAARDDGLQTEWRDAAGTLHSVLWDQPGQAELARVENASLAGGEAAFTSFDPLEDLSAWTFSGGTAARAGGGRASAGVLVLPPGGGATRAALAPDPTRPLLMSAWVRTPAGAPAQAGAGWTFALYADGSPLGSPVTLPFPATAGRWERQFTVLDLPVLAGGASGVTLVVSLANTARVAAAVAVDDLILVPLGAQLAGINRDSVWRLPLATLSTVGDATPVPRDGFQRPVGRTDATGSLTELTIPYLSRTGNLAGFSTADPNARMTLRALTGGSIQAFLDDSWIDAWTPTGADALEAADGVLAHADPASGATLTAASTPAAGTMALYVELVSLDGGPLALRDGVTVGVGTGIITVAPGTDGSLQCGFALDGSAVGSATTLPSPLTSLLLAQLHGRLLVWVNGQLQLSWTGTLAGAPAVGTGRNALGLRNLALIDGVALDLRYQDATGADRQRHALTAEEYTLDQVVRDAAGREIVSTKRAPGLFGSGASVPVPAYRPGFVNLAPFLTGLDGAATMAGDVADWYAAANAANASDDAGFPYTRTIREPARGGRPVETGLPGASLAVIDFAATSPASRATWQHRYGNEVTLGVPACLGLSAGSASAANYRVARILDPAKSVTASVADATGAACARFGGTGTVTLATLTAVDYGVATLTTRMLQPDYYALPDPRLLTTEQRNPLGQIARTGSPDEGDTRYLYDRAGRVRLLQDAWGAEQGEAVYLTWDALGRPRSRGVVAFDWATDTAAAAQALADPHWPENQKARAFTLQRTWTWDGDGGDLNAVGRVAALTAMTPEESGGTVQVAYAYTYDANGRVITRSLTFTPPSGTATTAAVGYGYDNQGRLSAIDYPAAAGDGLRVVYGYDGRGRIVSINDAAGTSYATYVYDAQGNVVGGTRGGAAAGVTLSRTVDSLDRVSARGVTTPDGVSYTAGIGWALDGMLTRSDETLAPAVAGFEASVAFGYDPVWRLTSAHDARGDRSLTLGFTTADGTLEQNGNVRSVTASDGSKTWIAYRPGTNQVASVTPASGEVTTCAFQANGALASAKTKDGALTFAYVPGTIQPMTATPPSGPSISYALDGKGQRVYRQGAGARARLTILDEAGGPLVTLASDGSAAAWVQGPDGLVGRVSGGTRWSVVTDELHTPRLVFDAAGALVAAYAYDALGGRTVVSEPSPGFLPWGFTGHAWDADLGLYDFGARFYDPVTGRFLAPDPEGEFPSPYCHAANQPTMRTDPTGMSVDWGKGALEAVLLVAGIGVGIWTGGAALAAVEAAGTVYLSVAGGAVSGALMNAAAYTRGTPSSRWSVGGLLGSAGLGALGGAAGGVVAGFATNAMKAEAMLTMRVAQSTRAAAGQTGTELLDMSPAARLARNQPVTRLAPTPRSPFVGNVLKAAGFGAARSAVQSTVQTGFTNLFSGKSFGDHLGHAALMGALTGGGFGALSGVFAYNSSAYSWKTQITANIKSGIAPSTLGMVKAGALYLGASAALVGGSAVYVAWQTNDLGNHS